MTNTNPDRDHAKEGDYTLAFAVDYGGTVGKVSFGWIKITPSWYEYRLPDMIELARVTCQTLNFGGTLSDYEGRIVAMIDGATFKTTRLV